MLSPGSFKATTLWALTANRVAQGAISLFVLGAIGLAVFARFFPGVIV